MYHTILAYPSTLCLAMLHMYDINFMGERGPELNCPAGAN